MSRPVYNYRVSLYMHEDGTPPSLWLARKPEAMEVPPELLRIEGLSEGKYDWNGSAWVLDPTREVSSTWNPRKYVKADGPPKPPRPAKHSKTLAGALVSFVRERLQAGQPVPRKDVVQEAANLGYKPNTAHLVASRALAILIRSGEASKVRDGKRMIYVPKPRVE